MSRRLAAREGHAMNDIAMPMCDLGDRLAEEAPPVADPELADQLPVPAEAGRVWAVRAGWPVVPGDQGGTGTGAGR
jgi:hypothetical protein